MDMGALSWFWLGMSAFTLLMFWVEQRSAAHTDDSVLFGVTLPAGESLFSPAVRAIQKGYAMQCRIRLAVGAVCSLPLWWFWAYPSVQITYLFAWVVALLFFVVICPYAMANRRLAACKQECGWVTESSDEPYKNDVYWKYGVYYNNPQDPSFTVPGRMRNGMMFNFGNPKAKAVFIVLMTVVVIILVSVLTPLMMLDFSSPRFSLQKDMLTIVCPLFGTSVPLAQMQSISLTDTVPDASYHTNGGATPNWVRGAFRVHDEKVVFFIYRRHPPYIAVRMKDGSYLFYNERDDVRTRLDYAALQRAVQGTGRGT